MHVIHDEVVATVVIATDFVDRRDILMMKRAYEASLIEKHRDERVVVVGDAEVERLDDHLTFEATEAGRTSQVHLPHAARGEMAEDFVPADFLNAEQRTTPGVKRRSPYTHAHAVRQEVLELIG